MNIIQNLLNPPILFFLLGAFGTLAKVRITIPSSIAKFLSMYLLISIGLQGGVELQHASFSLYTLTPLAIAMLFAALTPVYNFFLLRKKVSTENAAAIAASYGSVSAVTFITGINFLQTSHVAYNSFMIAAMALMESPAIIVGLMLAQHYNAQSKKSIGSIIKEALFDSSVFLILGSLCIGLLIGSTGMQGLAPFFQSNFKGMLCFFMLDMGLLAAQSLEDLLRDGIFLIPFGLLIPLLNACTAIGLGYLTGMSQGNTLLLAILGASASYIAVPAAMRITLPQANPSYYIPMALGITFPLNIIFGIPAYMWIITHCIPV